MKRILIHKDISEIEYGIWTDTDYKTLYSELVKQRGGNCPNFANQLWLQGLVSEITTQGVKYDFLTEDMTIEKINASYDCMIKPCANIFSTAFASTMESLASKFEKIKIPIYVISCGIQIDEENQMDELIHQIGKTASRFIESVYQAGGEFCLRGYSTKKFFDKLGFPSAVVTGCPSLYQKGRNLQVIKKEVPKSEFKAVINGQNYLLNTSFYHHIFRDFPDSIFIDQDHYFEYLYHDGYISQESLKLTSVIRQIKDRGYLGLDLVSSGRLLLFADMPDWMEFLRNSDFAFSFGARIHGNIMSILSGIPAMVHPCDCRTKEMAEFFDIPYITNDELKKCRDLYDIYEKLDYSIFNAKFQKKYDFFEKFLIDHGIIENQMNQNNIFVSNASDQGNVPDVVNAEILEQLNHELHKNKMIYYTVDRLFSLYRKIRDDCL